MALPQAWFRNLTLRSLLTAACPWVPIPWLDDHLLSRIREGLVRDWVEETASEIDPLSVRILAGSERPFRPMGCFIGAILATSWRVLTYFFRKLVRKILFVLLIKESTEVASATFHEAYLVRHALRSRSKTRAIRAGEAWEIRKAIERTCAEFDTRPIVQVLRRSLRGSRALVTWAATPHRTPDSRREGRWQRLVDGVSGSLWEQEGYLRALGERFEGHRAHLDSERAKQPGTI